MTDIFEQWTGKPMIPSGSHTLPSIDDTTVGLAGQFKFPEEEERTEVYGSISGGGRACPTASSLERKRMQGVKISRDVAKLLS